MRVVLVAFAALALVGYVAVASECPRFIDTEGAGICNNVGQGPGHGQGLRDGSGGGRGRGVGQGMRDGRGRRLGRGRG